MMLKICKSYKNVQKKYLYYFWIITLFYFRLIIITIILRTFLFFLFVCLFDLYKIKNTITIHTTLEMSFQVLIVGQFFFTTSNYYTTHDIDLCIRPYFLLGTKINRIKYYYFDIKTNRMTNVIVSV